MTLQTPGLTLQLQNPLLPQGHTPLNNIFSCQRTKLVLTPFIPATIYPLQSRTRSPSGKCSWICLFLASLKDMKETDDIFTIDLSK